MYGRYGNDALTRFLLIVALILIIISWIPHMGLVYLVALAIMIWGFARSFSRNLAKRRQELERYLHLQKPVVNFFKLLRNKWRDRKTHVYFKCKKCKAVLRVPKGKGHIDVTCPKCKAITETRT